MNVDPPNTKINKNTPLEYSLINMRQLHIFPIKQKLDMGLFVDFYVLPEFAWSEPKIVLFWCSEQF